MATTKESSQSTVQKYVAVDAGNRFVKFFDQSGNPRRIPSYIKKLEDWQDEIIPDNQSVTIETSRGKFVVGQMAKELNGSPTFMENKSALATLLVTPAIELAKGSTLPLVIKNLVLALPDSRNQENRAFLKALEGNHRMLRNGQEINYRIDKVTAVDECNSAFKFARSGGLYRDNGKINGVLDAGGGTTLAKLFSPNGTLLREGDVLLPGTNNLARLIAARLTHRLGRSVNLDGILDGIETGRYLIGTTTESFEAEFVSASREWYEGIRLSLKQSWEPFMHQIGEVLIVGGSAPLFQPLVDRQPRFKIVPDYQFSSVKGLALVGQEAS